MCSFLSVMKTGWIEDKREGTGVWQQKGKSTRSAIVPMRDLMRCVTIPLGWNTKAPFALSVRLSNFNVWHTWRKNWVNCAVLTGNSAGLRTVFSSRLSHTQLHSSLRKFHSFLTLPAHTTMASSQGTSVSSNSFSRWTSHDIFLFKYHFLLQFYAFLSSFRITLWPMWLANSKRQPCFYPP